MLTDTELKQTAGFDADRLDEIQVVFGAVADSTNSTATAQAFALGTEVMMSFLLPDVATATYLFEVPDKVEIIDVTVIKDAAGAGNTIQLKDGSDNAISDAIAAAVDKTVTRAGTLDKLYRTIAAGGTLKVVNTRAAGSSAAAVFVKAIRRA